MRVGVLGVGRIGAFHAETLAHHDPVGEVVVVDADAGRAADVAERVGGRTAPDLDACLEVVDAVVITTPTSLHAEQIRRAVDAGLPVFCEKPIALDLDATRAVIRRVRDAGGRLQMGFQRRFDAGYRRAAELVAAGGLGTPYLVRMAGHDPHPPHASYVPTSGGIFRDLHIHDFDALRFVTGLDVEEAYADGSVLGFELFAEHGDVDTAAAVLRLEGGTLGILSGARHDPLGYDVRMELFGSEDSVAVGWDGRTPLRSLEVGGPSRPGKPYASFLDRFAPAYRTELERFVRFAAGEVANPCPPEDALEAMRIAVACDRSRERREPVSLEEVT